MTKQVITCRVIRLLEVDEKHIFNKPSDRSKTVCLCVLLCWMVDQCGFGSLTDMKLHYGDLTDSMCLVKIISEARPTEIYNLAAQSHVKVSVWPPKTPPKPTFIFKKNTRENHLSDLSFPVKTAPFLSFSVTSQFIFFFLLRCREEEWDPE